MAKINPKKSAEFAKNAATNKTKYKRKKYPEAFTVRLDEDTAKTIKAIAYYERESQRETIERAMDALLKQMDPNDIKKALKIYDKQ
jgi:hypothetical protein